MNFNLPFFDRKGTISSIVDSEKCYMVYRYDLDGTPKFISNVPKNAKNYELLFENYCNDLKAYLDVNSTKYESYKTLNLSKMANSKLINFLMILSVIMIGTSIPLLLNFEVLGILGITLDLLSVPALVATMNLSIKEASDKKKIKFMGEYQEFERRYELYSEEKIKENNVTKYKGLRDVNKENKIIDLNLVRELKKVS